MKVRAIKSILVLIILVSFISCNKDSQEDNVKVNPNPDSTIVSMSRKMFYDLSNHNENYSETFFYDSLNRLISKSNRALMTMVTLFNFITILAKVHLNGLNLGLVRQR